MLRLKSVVIAGFLITSGCSLFYSSPSSVVKQLMADAKKGDVDGMVSLWSSKAIQEEGAEKIRSNAQHFADFNKQVRDAGEDPQVQNIRETIQGDRARVFFLYRDEQHKDSVGMGFALLKENGKWKLYRSLDVGEENQPFESAFAPRKTPATTSSPEPPGPMEMVSPVPTPPASNSSRNSEDNSNSSAAPTGGATISGGVLNSKATSLPKPAYPAAARAVKASGTVVVQVMVDESGRVTSATAVSGHPLLHASAVAAARQAKFNPTIVGGKYVKVTGTLSFQFSPE